MHFFKSGRLAFTHEGPVPGPMSLQMAEDASPGKGDAASPAPGLHLDVSEVLLFVAAHRMGVADYLATERTLFEVDTDRVSIRSLVRHAPGGLEEMEVPLPELEAFVVQQILAWHGGPGHAAELLAIAMDALTPTEMPFVMAMLGPNTDQEVSPGMALLLATPEIAVLGLAARQLGILQWGTVLTPDWWIDETPDGYEIYEEGGEETPLSVGTHELGDFVLGPLMRCMLGVLDAKGLSGALSPDVDGHAASAAAAD